MHEVLHDTLTGLPNRTLFLDRLDLTLKQQRRDPKRTFAVLFLDLDGFKTINDSLGHAAGDELLIEFGKRLSMFLRPGDSVARLGGDEFAILLTDISGINEATRVAERIHELLSLKFVIGDKDVYANRQYRDRRQQRAKLRANPVICFGMRTWPCTAPRAAAPGRIACSTA